ncbi:hypothetical protein ASE61_25205 [Bosea sp. Root670]|nr:hypothetical protein ASE61_25205 [Bosea sp. Root670]
MDAHRNRYRSGDYICVAYGDYAVSRGLSSEGTNLDAAMETLPQWLLTAINLVGVMVFALLQT